LKVLLAVLCVSMALLALRIEPVRDRSLLMTRKKDGPVVRLMTWNVGYAELEKDNRAHTEDLKAIAETILRANPDAVALQELTGEQQLKTLLGHLQGKYRGSVASATETDRVEAVLVRDRNCNFARFAELNSDNHHSISATFQFGSLPEMAIVSAHADAFNAARRRELAGDVVDWTRKQPASNIIFIAGDFNFEVNSKDESNFYTNNEKHDSEAYSLLLKYFRDLGKDAGDTAINDRRIDYVFGPSETVLLKRAEVLRSEAVGRMDHWPLLVEVTL
jgi:endonuclease/exonuclease/phosphatase family metal-dependent hydrolase